MNINKAQEHINTLVKVQNAHFDSDEEHVIDANADSHIDLDKRHVFDEDDFELTRIFPATRTNGMHVLMQLDVALQAMLNHTVKATNKSIAAIMYYARLAVLACRDAVKAYEVERQMKTCSIIPKLRVQKTTQLSVYEIDSIEKVLPINYVTKTENERNVAEAETEETASLFKMCSYVSILVLKKIFSVDNGRVIDNEKNYCFTNQ